MEPRPYLSSQGYDLTEPTVQNLTTLALAVTEMWLGHSKFKMGHMSVATLFSVLACQPIYQT